jgi:hypothetical protein
MPQAGVTARARRRDATPWWEELDRDAFQFPTDYQVKPARRAVAAAQPAAAVAERPVAAAERRVAVPGRRAAAAERPVAMTEGTVAAAERTMAMPERMVASAPPPASARPRATEGERRTVVIRGRGAERNLPVARPTLRRHERPGFRADRAAMWAVMLGLLLILVAATSAHAAILH